MVRIKLCKKYYNKKKLAKKLALNYPDAEIKIKSCIGMCKHCKLKPSAIINHKKIKKKSIKSFLKKVKDD